MKFAIAMSTYRRGDGSTPEYITRALNSVLAQTHQDYKMFLIGDHYDNEEEFNSFGATFSPEKIYKRNLPVAVERSKYKMGTRELWCSGGANAHNTLLDEIVSQGYDYVCRLDHDDYWADDHLESINRVIEQVNDAACVYTCSTYPTIHHLPRIPTLDGTVYLSFPTPVNVVHSSTCINYGKVPLRYRDVFAETGQVLEADIDMWNRLKEFCEKSSLKSYVIAKITCHHPDEKKTK
jgi:glycosyltransferase involved in cell wall biosynthesis